MAKLIAAPPIQASAWINTPRPLSLADFHGRVVLLEAFQMLCPGCVSEGLPQAQRVRKGFDPKQVAVIGLHSVFEHHDAQGSQVALEAFAHEYRLDFPIAIDAPGNAGGIPLTMEAYAMRGTPSLILIDRIGRLRMHRFGHVEDLLLGSALTTLLLEDLPSEPSVYQPPTETTEGCDAHGCVIPTAA